MTPAELRAELAAAPAGIRRLEKLMEILRGPDGCPWDRDQTHRSLAPYLLEETYEALDALDALDGEAGDDDLAEELGDVLLQIVFHAQLAAETGRFDLDTIAQREVDKMVERHPHVFADVEATSADDVRSQWEARKRARKPRRGIADGVPRAMPALNRAQTISARASGLGFDWEHLEEAWAKLHEEIDELAEHVETGDRERDHDALEDELGDVLFVLVNVARKAGLDAEAALRRATDKFCTRFDRMERFADARVSGEAARTRWDRAWSAAKHPRPEADDASS